MLDVLEGSLRTDLGDGGAVVAAAEDTEIRKLLGCHLHITENLVIVKGGHYIRAFDRAINAVANHERTAIHQSVHILGHDRVHETNPAHLRGI